VAPSDGDRGTEQVALVVGAVVESVVCVVWGWCLESAPGEGDEEDACCGWDGLLGCLLPCGCLGLAVVEVGATELAGLLPLLTLTVIVVQEGFSPPEEEVGVLDSLDFETSLLLSEGLSSSIEGFSGGFESLPSAPNSDHEEEGNISVSPKQSSRSGQST